VAGFYVGIKISKHRIVFQQMRESLCVRDVIDRNEVYVTAFERRAKHVPPDPAKSVYAYFNPHLVSSRVQIAASECRMQAPGLSIEPSKLIRRGIACQAAVAGAEQLIARTLINKKKNELSIR